MLIQPRILRQRRYIGVTSRTLLHTLPTKMSNPGEMEKPVTTVMIVTAVLLGSAFAAQAAPLRHGHAARVPGCMARQQAVIALLGQYGADLPSVSPTLQRLHTQCMPVNHNVD